MKHRRKFPYVPCDSESRIYL